MSGSPHPDASWPTLEELLALRADAQALPALSQLAARSGFSGSRASVQRGRGLLFEELRHYQPGDDTRRLDWQATRRTGQPMVQVFTEERERPVQLLLDLQARMQFGSRCQLKSALAIRLAALLLWQSQTQGDRLGALICRAGQREQIRPRRSEQACLHLLQQLCLTPSAQRPSHTDASDQLPQGLLELGRLARHSSDLWLISDLDGLCALADGPLLSLARHNQLNLVLISDPLEQQLPDAGRWPFSEGQQYLLLDSSDPDLRQRYAADYQHQLHSLQRRLAPLPLTLLMLTTATPLLHQLAPLAGRR